MQSVLFLCLGNICRSPLAEGATRAAFAAAGLEIDIDSAGTGDWHIGRAPDPRAQAIARAHGVDIGRLAARQLAQEDFERFDLILAADHENLADLHAEAPPGARARLALMLDMVPGREGAAVADPYYGDADGFARCWADVTAVANALVAMNRG
jgi:protein-tyrosine phosphatase